MDDINKNIVEPIKVLEILKNKFKQWNGFQISSILENIIESLTKALEGLKNLNPHKKKKFSKKVSKLDLENAKSLLNQYKIIKDKLLEHNKLLKDSYSQQQIKSSPEMKKIIELKKLMAKLKRLKAKKNKVPLEKIEEVDEEYDEETDKK